MSSTNWQKQEKFGLYLERNSTYISLLGKEVIVL